MPFDDDECAWTGGFMVVEFVGGIIANALALQADAMHMASDLIALIIGYWAISLARRPESQYNTYGWSRFEVIGAMINSVFLFAVCFNIFVEAVDAHARHQRGEGGV